MSKVFVIGSVNMDLVICADRMPKSGETISGYGFMTNPGGKGANQAVAAAKMNAETYMVGCVGVDAFGDELQKALAGSYNKIIEVNTYNNGNTGIQISGVSTETIDKWPAYNQVINCTSYNNADNGYEDADGFAAKLTCGPGNVFDGCIAYNNADDGWDLYAKIQTGPIGVVTIKNCIAYSNGYLSDGTNAGNGNGFKLGGTSLIPCTDWEYDEDNKRVYTYGQHELINSIAYNNKAKGIDSNSCPAIKVVNCTSYNNGSYNVAFYTHAGNTNFEATGIISFKQLAQDWNGVEGGFDAARVAIGEQLKPNNQDNAKFQNETTFYWDGSQSSNGTDQITADDFVSLDTTIAP